MNEPETMIREAAERQEAARQTIEGICSGPCPSLDDVRAESLRRLRRVPAKGGAR